MQGMLGGGKTAHAAACVALALGVSMLAPAANVRAASLTVTTFVDAEDPADGLCSLREAIIAANANAAYHECTPSGFGDDTITFADSGTISLASPLPDILAAGTLTIDGAGRSITIAGVHAYRPFYVNAGADLTLNHLAVVNGHADFGGAVRNDGSFSAVDCEFSRNDASDSGGAIQNGSGHLAEIIGSVFTDNIAEYGGGAISNSGTLIADRSTFTDNSAVMGGAVITGAPGTATITGSAFSGNLASDGAGVNVYSGTAEVINTTFSGNTGTISDEAGVMVSGTASFLHSTFFGNGIGIYSNGTVTVRNSILAGSTGLNCGVNPGSTLTDGGNNIDSGATCGWGSGSGTLSGTDPLLSAFGNHGGRTGTFALLAGSPAVDGVTWNAPNLCPADDQRGFTRSDPVCDIGAFEAGVGAFVFLPFG